MIAEKKESKYALIQVRVFKEALAQAKETAAIRTAAEGREVTYNEVIRQQVETGRKVMAFQMNPTDAAAAAAFASGRTHSIQKRANQITFDAVELVGGVSLLIVKCFVMSRMIAGYRFSA